MAHAIQENVQALIDTWPPQERPHQACVEAGPARACRECIIKINRAFDAIYGDVPPDRVRTRIAIDAHTSRRF